MSVSVITPPAPIISLAEAKMHIRVSDDVGELEDGLISAYIAAATAWLDGPAGWLGRAIAVQVLEWRGDTWPCRGDELPYPPTIEIVSVVYIDQDGVEQEWPFPTPLYWDDLPAIRGNRDDVRIRYRAGYGKLGAGENPQWENYGVPEPIRVAVLMLVSQWYYNRDAVSETLTPNAMPFGVEALLSPYRIYR